MPIGTFTVTIDGEQLGAGTETAAKMRVQFAGDREFIKDPVNAQFIFPHLSNERAAAISLPYTLTLATDVDTGQSEDIGYVVTVTTAAGGTAKVGPFPAEADGAEVALVDLAAEFNGQVAESIAVRAEQARDEAEAAATAAATFDPVNFVSEGAAFADLAKQAGVDVTGATDTGTATQTALDAFLALGVRGYARGTIKSSTTLVIKGNVDLSDLTIDYTGTGLAVRVGNTAAATSNLKVKLPKVIRTQPTPGTWTASTCGVELTNLYACEIDVHRVSGFEDGLRLYGNGHGVSYNTIRLGTIVNNKRNSVFDADAGVGFVNQNTFFGGRFQHGSEQGTDVAGTRHVLISNPAQTVDGNVFVGTSFESPSVVEYQIECHGVNNYFMQCRFEDASTPRVYWRAGAQGNVISFGVGAKTITETWESGAKSNEIHSIIRRRFVGGNSVTETLRLESEGADGTSPVLRIMEPTAAARGISGATGYAIQSTARMLQMKREGDAGDRVRIDFYNNRIYVGGGTGTPTMYFGTVGAGMGFDGGHFYFGTDNTYDIGASSSNRPRFVRAGTALRTGAFATGSRPSTPGAGAMVFDTTLNKPIWHNGTNWVDATGTTV